MLEQIADGDWSKRCSTMSGPVQTRLQVQSVMVVDRSQRQLSGDVVKSMVQEEADIVVN